MNIPKIRPQATATEETPRGSSRPQNPSNTLPSSCSNVVVGIETMERVEQPLPVPTSTSPQQTPKSLQHGQISVEYLYKGGSLGRCYESREGGALPSYLDTGFPNMRALSELTVYMNAEDFDL